ncbi:MAG: MBOAT family protein, partial [Acutalibacteraceae bacterium]|nr:MBOAT family protein [Acutalibacteraceae bacterium]
FFNIFVVWMLTGFWHGAAWNFIIWGLYFAVLLVIEKQFLLKYLDKSKALARIYTLFAVLISFVIFNSANMGEAFEYIKNMLGFGVIPIVSDEFLYYIKSFAVIVILAIIGATPIVKSTAVKLSRIDKLSYIQPFAESAVLVFLLIITTAYLVDGSFNPFLYFRF